MANCGLLCRYNVCCMYSPLSCFMHQDFDFIFVSLKIGIDSLYLIYF